MFEGLDLDPSGWTDLPAADRDRIAEAFLPRLMTDVRPLSCDGGTTLKTLWRLHDGSLVESVLMRYGVPGIRSSGSGRNRATLCISSQAGCGMACPFCATGQGGLQRNLSAAEIIAQVLAGARTLADGEIPGGPGRINNIVFMGMGEPMANYKAIMGTIRTLTASGPARVGHQCARHHRLDRRPGAPDRRPGGRRDSGHTGRQPARARRRVARRVVPDQHPLERGRTGRGGLALLRRDQAPGLDRVRADP